MATTHRQSDVFQDALYRVMNAEYVYHGDAGVNGSDVATNWRADHAASGAADPMRTDPAPMAPSLPTERVNSLTWEYDWLGNMQDWTDDAASFYERSIGDIENGADRATPERRPRSTSRATSGGKSGNGTIDNGVDRGGWVELQYGEDGNVASMLVHAQCTDLVIGLQRDSMTQSIQAASMNRASKPCSRKTSRSCSFMR